MSPTRLAAAFAATLLACGGSSDAPQQHPVTLRVTLPAGTPDADTVYLAGTPSQWAPASAAWALSPDADGTRHVTVSFARPGDTVEFKFTRGGWDRAELDAAGWFVKNRVLTWDGHQTSVDLTVDQWLDVEAAGSGTGPLHTAVGAVLVRELSLTQLDGSPRSIRIYLPPDYATSGKRYPVLYMFDGKNLYDRAGTAFNKEWKIDETLEQLFADGQTTGVIVVGIDQAATGAGRYAEYTGWDWTSPSAGPITAVGDQFSHFVVDTVMPYVNAVYRTLPDREHTGIAGSSMGGYMSIYTGTKFQDRFSKIASFSTVALDSPMNGQLLRAFVEASRPVAPYTIYLDIGDSESLSYASSATLIAGNQAMCDSFGKAGYTVTCRVIPGAQHDESYWAARFPEVFKLLFP